MDDAYDAPELQPVLSIDSSLTCKICHSLFEGPVALTCGHAYCSLCIRSNFDFKVKSNDKTACPACRQPCTAADLRPSLALRDTVEIYKAVRSQLENALIAAAQPQQAPQQPASRPAAHGARDSRLQRQLRSATQQRRGEGERRHVDSSDEDWTPEAEQAAPEANGQFSGRPTRRRRQAQAPPPQPSPQLEPEVVELPDSSSEEELQGEDGASSSDGSPVRSGSPARAQAAKRRRLGVDAKSGKENLGAEGEAPKRSSLQRPGSAPPADPSQQQQQQPADGRLPCPICGISVAEAYMNVHLDACLARSSAAQPKPLPAAHAAGAGRRSKAAANHAGGGGAGNHAAHPAAAHPAGAGAEAAGQLGEEYTVPAWLCLNLLKPKVLKAKLQELGLSAEGSRQDQEQRYTQFRTFMQSRLDSGKQLTRKRAAALFNKGERSSSAARQSSAGLASVAAAAGGSDGRGAGAGSGSAANGHSYAELIREARERDQERRRRQQGQQEQQGQREQEQAHQEEADEQWPQQPGQIGQQYARQQDIGGAGEQAAAQAAAAAAPHQEEQEAATWLAPAASGAGVTVSPSSGGGCEGGDVQLVPSSPTAGGHAAACRAPEACIQRAAAAQPLGLGGGAAVAVAALGAVGGVAALSTGVAMAHPYDCIIPESPEEDMYV